MLLPAGERQPSEVENCASNGLTRPHTWTCESLQGVPAGNRTYGLLLEKRTCISLNYRDQLLIKFRWETIKEVCSKGMHVTFDRSTFNLETILSECFIAQLVSFNSGNILYWISNLFFFCRTNSRINCEKFSKHVFVHQTIFTIDIDCWINQKAGHFNFGEKLK